MTSDADHVLCAGCITVVLPGVGGAHSSPPETLHRPTGEWVH